MSLSSQNEVEQHFLLSAKMDNAKNILQPLKAINFDKNATVFGSAEGLKVTVEDGKTAQANAFIPASMFQEYTVNNSMLTIRVNLNAFVECLNIFGVSSEPSVTPALTLCYEKHGSPLVLLLEEAGVVTDCKLTTQDAEETLDFDFANDKVVNKVIIRSDCLREVFAELDLSSDLLELHMGPQSPHFRITTHGSYGINHTDIAKESEVIESFKCNVSTTYKYKFNLLKHSMKAMAASQKASIRVDERGFLCMQFMILTEDKHTAYVEFYCCPQLDLND